MISYYIIWYHPNTASLVLHCYITLVLHCYIIASARMSWVLVLHRLGWLAILFWCISLRSYIIRSLYVYYRIVIVAGRLHARATLVSISWPIAPGASWSCRCGVSRSNGNASACPFCPRRRIFLQRPEIAAQLRTFSLQPCTMLAMCGYTAFVATKATTKQ